MPNPLQRTAGIIRGAASAVRRPFSRSLTRYPSFSGAIASTSPVRRNTPLATSYGDRVLPQVIGGTPTEFQLELQKIVMNRLAAKNEKVREAFNAIASELTTLPESVAATPGFAGLNLDQARRLSSIQEGGLQNLLSGLSSVIPQQQQRTDYLSGLATQAYAENLQRQTAEAQGLQREREKGEERELQLTELALGLPQGQSLDVLGRTVRGLKQEGGVSGGKNRIVTPQEGGYYAVDDQGRIVGGRDPYGQTFGFENMPVSPERVLPGGVSSQEGPGKSLVVDYEQLFYGSSKNKYGLDLAGPIGSPVHSSTSGVVVSAGVSGGWGNQIRIRDSENNIHQYSHFKSISVEPGQTISSGDEIGTRGNTGAVLKATGEPVSDEERKAGRGAHTDYTVYKPDGGPYDVDIAARFAGVEVPSQEKKKITRREAEDEANKRNITDPQKVVEFVNATIRNNEFPTEKKDLKEIPSEQVNNLALAQLSRNSIEKIGKLMENVTDQGPIMGRIRLLNPYDTEAVRLKNLITQTVPGLARGIFKEVGILTDTDIERYTTTISNLTLTKEQAKQATIDLLQKIDDSIKGQLDTLEKSGYNVEGFRKTSGKKPIESFYKKTIE